MLSQLIDHLTDIYNTVEAKCDEDPEFLTSQWLTSNFEIGQHGSFFETHFQHVNTNSM